ncbi:carnitine dehydratase [Sorangium cellulosum]|uniref:Carnitine dehydratase n=1 Tax=Sorangium cellulosum TaxID=56 RepID=A0A4P2PYN9_SORCE|nr:CaiB/BaiF CoA-transferase family protein [Sorangium cellulosum]AUX21708.1 carnitine dehydratase [Sorangium cellulosum]
MRPLTDTRILDLSRLLPGPFATLVLADLGATVDKLEDVGGGDLLRHLPPQIAGESAAFQLLNRGKRSVLLDLKRPEGRDAFRRLVATYDVLLDPFRPGVLDRLGLGHDALRADNPRLIVCALTGYGQTGPLAARAGHDLNYVARAGVLGAQGPPEGPPQVPGSQVADVSGGMWCAVAVLAALRERERTGRGAVLDIAMTDGVLGFALPTLAAALAGGASPAGAPARAGEEPLTGGLAPYNIYLSKDGHAMALAALEPKFWRSFCEGAGLDPEVDALVPGPHQVELKDRLAAVFLERTRAEWEAFAAERDCCLEPVIDPRTAATDPHLASRGLLFEIASPRGRVPQLRTPVTPRDASFAPAPRAGEHTRAVLRDAGFSEDEVEALIRAGAAREAR